MYRGSGKSLARAGRKQANVSVRMAWISFDALPCKKKITWWHIASRCCWNRARHWHASELVSFLVGLRTYQHPVSSYVSYTTPTQQRESISGYRTVSSVQLTLENESCGQSTETKYSGNTATCFGCKSSAGRTILKQKWVNFKTAIQVWDLKTSQVKPDTMYACKDGRMKELHTTNRLNVSTNTTRRTRGGPQ